MERQAWRSAVWGWLRHRPTKLLPFAAVKARLHMRAQHDLGIQNVRLDHIVGSEGRFGEFDRAFNPRSRRLAERWKRIGRARFHGEYLPPVELFKVGDIYFVRDGNHRLSVARSLGPEEIDAHVVKIETNVPLLPDLDEAGLERKAAQSGFVEEIGLLEARPGAAVPREASDPGTYEELRRHVHGHQYFMGIERGRAVSGEEAVAHWYDYVYLPQVEAMRRLHIGAAFPRRTETSLFLSIMKHRHELTERNGVDPGPEQAVIDFMERFGPWRAHQRFSRLIRSAGQSVLGWLQRRLPRGLRGASG